MIGRLGEIEETPGSPDKAFPSRRDPEVRLYTRSFYENNDWVVVAVAVKVDDAFILTAYVTSEVPG